MPLESDETVPLNGPIVRPNNAALEMFLGEKGQQNLVSKHIEHFKHTNCINTHQ